MALIPFPHQQLFHKQLDSFDLIIFDRYRNQGILQKRTYQNIARYLKEGGALLIASGPEYLTEKSIYNTALKEILSGTPAKQIHEKSFKPSLSERGRVHPITRELSSGEFSDENWANWLRQISVNVDDSKVLMTGEQNAPLLIISEENKGRLIHLTSDQIWLWARQYKQGGPYIDLMRKMIHWLLKEPSLEEGQIELSIAGDTIRVKRYINPLGQPLNYTDPEGNTGTLMLERSPDKLYRASLKADKQGLYSFSSGDNSAYIIYGAYDTIEQTTLISTSETTKAVVSKTGGNIYKADSLNNLNVKTVKDNSTGRYHGISNIAFRKSSYAETTKLEFFPLLPIWVYFLIFTAFIFFAWHRESE